MKKRELIEVLVYIVYTCIYIFLAFQEVINYNVFPQAYELYKNNVGISDLIFSLHPHSLRYAVIFPSILVSKFWSIEIHKVNTFYTIFIFIMIIKNINIVIKKFLQKNYLHNLIITGIFIITISFFINGRIAFAFFGQTLVMKSFSIEKNKMRNKILGLFFSTISSGTMLVVLAAIFLGNHGQKKIKIKFKSFVLLICLFPILIFFYKFVINSLKKNLLFYDGSVYKVFQHGILGKLYNYSYFNIILGIYIFLVLLYYYINLKRKKINIIIIFQFIAFVFGLFGITTFYMCLIPIYMHILIFFGKRIKIENKK